MRERERKREMTETDRSWNVKGARRLLYLTARQRSSLVHSSTVLTLRLASAATRLPVTLPEPVSGESSARRSVFRTERVPIVLDGRLLRETGRRTNGEFNSRSIERHNRQHRLARQSRSVYNRRRSNLPLLGALNPPLVTDGCER